MSRRPVIIVALALAALTPTGSAAVSASPSGSWSGTYTLRGENAITVTIAGRRATVALGGGHAGVQTVRVTVRAGRVRFALPGRPTPLAFDGRLRRGRIQGTVRQGAARGTLRLRRGLARGLLAPGFYEAGGRTLAVVPGTRLLDVQTGDVHGLYARGTAYDIGAGFRTRAPTVGTATLGAAGGTIGGVPAARIRMRQLEVRFPSGRHVLSGTLTLPPGAGPHPAVAWVHGAGFVGRNYFPDIPALLAGSGLAVLVYDKQGVGQSGGRFQGDAASDASIGALARDAEAAARFLAAQPEIDRARVALAGHSQGGWIAPLAASREPAVTSLLVFAGPALSQGETDLWAELAGAGNSPPQRTDAEIEAEVLRRGPSGYDPTAAIRALRIPSLWLFGGLDRVVPSRLSVQRLQPVGGDLAFEVFPNGNHALVETQSGMNAEMLGSSRFAPGLFPRVRDWVGQRLARPGA